MSDPVIIARNALAGLYRANEAPNPVTVAAYKRELELAKLAKQIDRFIADHKPTPEQRARLAKRIGGAA